MKRASSQDLLLVSKAAKDKLDAFAFGATLVHRTGYSLNELRAKAALDRLSFAREVLSTAEFSLRARPPMPRVAVTRGYYAMYHAFRTVCFFVHGGDDYEKHSELPSKLPRDFPNRATWENKLKGARLERNRADYDPYPKNSNSFAAAAEQLVQDTKSLIPIVKDYLKSKGCRS